MSNDARQRCKWLRFFGEKWARTAKMKSAARHQTCRDYADAKMAKLKGKDKA